MRVSLASVAFSSSRFSWSTLIAWAKQLGRDDCAGVLQENLDEEKATDAKLTRIADSKINQRAA
ncbi:hypothetical protein AOPFMNJM_4159 [Methylobacterium jeotgali]|uniref:Uncharacterized protein n=2 Tax=Methylobacterium jeotgali TaxID=381630 RepID=A0ABQ4T3M2_9HYPH|nr:hypothetical protein AOPFMNJM_4159 [Methylobacterium jeotgali]